MSMPVLRDLYPHQHKPLEALSPLAKQLLEVIERGPIATVPLRETLGMTDKGVRARFDKALLELQVNFHVARSNAPGLENDTWVPFLTQYPALKTTG